MRTMRRFLIAVAALCALTVLAGCRPVQAPPPGAADAPAAEAAAPTTARGTIVAAKIAAAPALDGVADEAFWADAAPLNVNVAHGANTEKNEVTLKSVYTDDMIYFLVSWPDATESFVRSPWQKQEDGSWKKLSDPNDKGGDNNVYYEDKMAMIWDINDSIEDFPRLGCATACHLDKEQAVKPYGNKFTAGEGQMGDIWHWKSVRNMNQVDDQYLDSTQYSPDTPEAGRHSDPKDSGGYVDNQTEDKTMPAFMGPEGYPRDGAPGYILDEEKVPFDDSLFAAGDMIPGIIKSPFVGDRANISAGWKWADGVWTLELGRPLVTGSEFDVQFDDLAKPYYFGVAVFDNAQVRHAFQQRANTLVFQQ